MEELEKERERARERSPFLILELAQIVNQTSLPCH